MGYNYYKYSTVDLSNSPKYEKIYIIDNKNFKFTFQTNFRSEEINLSIIYIDENDVETILHNNISLFPNINLTQNISREYLDGELVLYDNTGNNRPPTYTNFETDYVFYYITEA